MTTPRLVTMLHCIYPGRPDRQRDAAFDAIIEAAGGEPGTSGTIKLDGVTSRELWASFRPPLSDTARAGLVAGLTQRGFREIGWTQESLTPRGFIQTTLWRDT